MKMGLDTLKREGVATWLLVILASVVVLAVGYKLLHATTQVLIHLGAYAMSDDYRTHPHGNRSELRACRMSKPRDAGDGRHANFLRFALRSNPATAQRYFGCARAGAPCVYPGGGGNCWQRTHLTSLLGCSSVPARGSAVRAIFELPCNHRAVSIAQ